MLLLLPLVVWSQTLDLSGKWGFQLDPTDFERAFQNAGAHRDPLADSIILPGTTDTNQKGIATTSAPINRLSRLYEYVGPAWYQKIVTIPDSWSGKRIELLLERVLWISSLYVDGDLVGEDKSFSTPHIYQLTDVLTPGRHTLAICIDNRVPAEFDRWCHAFSEYTQTAWNGIVGRIELIATDPVAFNDIQIYPDPASKSARIVCDLSNMAGLQFTGQIILQAHSLNPEKPINTPQISVPITETSAQVTIQLPMGDTCLLWDEFAPDLYELSACLSVQSGDDTYSDTRTLNFGMRHYGTDDHHFTINGRKIALRGTLECAIFPLTGYANMTESGWLRICQIVKSYGLNHIRFHSWCPPEAAFRAADQVGIYLQPELPCWTEVGNNDMLNGFYRQEMDRILKSYGNHPSFVQLCMGNELRGDFDYLAGLIQQGKAIDPRHLYSGATARKHLTEDEYYVSHRNDAGGMTTYGARGPQTDYDLNAAYQILKVPGVAHEVGQRAVYPNFKEIDKYTGVLYPRNFQKFKQALQQHHMLHQADDFYRASGQMTAFLYKESIEALLRTSQCGGFQLLDLHDFPGQGTALVGLLDPFWDSKGIISPEQFRQFCGPIVPLAKFHKREYYYDETFEADIEIYHYYNQPLKNLIPHWTLTDTSGSIIRTGVLPETTISVSTVSSLGHLSISFNAIKIPNKLTLTIHVGQDIRNSWEIWVYPRDHTPIDHNSFVEADTLEEAITGLNAGRNVLLLPDIRKIEGKQGSFQNHFWNPIMFRWEPMTMGALIQDKHPMFKDFPTEFYTNWQWWHIINHSRTMMLDQATPDLTPTLQVIDTYDRCLKLGTIFEAKVAGGKLLMASIDFNTNQQNRPASQQLLHSLRGYIAGPSFNPTVELSAEFIASLFKKPSLMTGASIVLCDSYENGNEPDKAIDDDPQTIWHTAYSSPGTFAITDKLPEKNYPHEIQIKLAGTRTFKGFRYVPRSDGVNGYVATYEFYISMDGQNWNPCLAQGRFPRNAKTKEVLFVQPVQAGYIRFVALNGFEGQKWASMAELELIPAY